MKVSIYQIIPYLFIYSVHFPLSVLTTLFFIDKFWELCMHNWCYWWSYITDDLTCEALVPFVQCGSVKNTHGEVLLLLKLQDNACNFTKSNTNPWQFFTFFKLQKWYQIAQSISYIHSHFYSQPNFALQGIHSVNQ